MDLKVNKASTNDHPLIQSLLESCDLPLDGVREHLSNFLIIKKENEVIGTVGLEIYVNKALLRSLAIAKEYQGNGFGQKLYLAIIKKAKKHGINEIYLLTETAEDFFSKQGFKIISRNSVDNRVKNSVEFRSACPETASCMHLKI